MNDATDRSPGVCAVSCWSWILQSPTAVAACPGYLHWNHKPEAAKPSVTFARHPRRDNILGLHDHLPDNPCIEY